VSGRLNGSPEDRARVQHDLQARLTPIVGYAELVLTREDESVREEGLKRILEAAEALRCDLEALFGEEPALPGATPFGRSRRLSGSCSSSTTTSCAHCCG
jgi:hypothetical protein